MANSVNYEYLRGDCVVEFNRNGERAVVLVAHGPCGCAEEECSDFTGKPMWERLRDGDKAAWREVERCYQLYKKYLAMPSHDPDRDAVYEECIAQNVSENQG